jgi:hypothetical protein
MADRDIVHAVIRGSAINNDGAQKAGYTARGRPGAGHRRGDGGRPGEPGDDQLRGGPRHGHRSRRPDRDRGPHPGLPRRDRPPGLLRDRLGESEPRPPRPGGRHRLAHQDRAHAEAPGASAPRPLRATESEDRLRVEPVPAEYPLDGVDDGRSPAARGRQLPRLRRDERPPGARRAPGRAAGRAHAPGPALRGVGADGDGSRGGHAAVGPAPACPSRCEPGGRGVHAPRRPPPVRAPARRGGQRRSERRVGARVSRPSASSAFSRATEAVSSVPGPGRPVRRWPRASTRPSSAGTWTSAATFSGGPWAWTCGASSSRGRTAPRRRPASSPRPRSPSRSSSPWSTRWPVSG